MGGDAVRRPEAHAALVAEVRDALARAGDPGRAAQQQAYMRSAMPFHGVGAPALRALLRPSLAEHGMRDRTQWEATVCELWDGATHREERYAALALARHRRYRSWVDAGTLPLWRHLVVTGAWWDLVDEVAAHPVGEVLRSHPEAVGPVLRSWAVEEDLWLRRTSILAQLHSRAGTDTDLLTHALEANLEGSTHGREFFVRKAVGWALRQHARTDPKFTRRFVAEHADALSGLSRREALKHLPG